MRAKREQKKAALFEVQEDENENQHNNIPSGWNPSRRNTEGNIQRGSLYKRKFDSFIRGKFRVFFGVFCCFGPSIRGFWLKIVKIRLKILLILL